MAQILLVEDDRTIRMALEYALTGAGYAVNTATDGRSGLEAARQGCDLILLDVMLPSLSGLEVARVLRSEGHTEPIIMLTALNQDHDKVAGLDAGADDYITKPFSVTELLARIRANLRRAERTGEHEPAVIEAGELVIDTRAARVPASPSSCAPRNTACSWPWHAVPMPCAPVNGSPKKCGARPSSPRRAP